MPVGRSTLILDDWSGGLNTDLPADKLPKSMATVLENADVKNKALKGALGAAAYLTGLPEGFVRISEGQFRLTVPSEQDITLVYGTLSGADKLYVRPYLSMAGAWVDSWQELTEKEGNNTADAGTNTTTVVDAALLSTTNDYYNGWILLNLSRAQSSVITDYDGSSKTITLAWAITSQTTGDSYLVCRNPVYTDDGNYIFSPDSVCRFSQRGNSIDIVTGSNLELGYHSDLVLTVLSNYAGFDDTDLNYSGLYLTVRAPQVLQLAWTQLAAIAAGSAEYAIGSDSAGTIWLLMAVAKYDGTDESPIWKGVGTMDGTQFTIASTASPNATSTGNDINISATSSPEAIRISVSISYGKSAVNVPLLSPGGAFASDINYNIIFDRRITSIVFYMAQATAASATLVTPRTEWRKVQEVLVNDSTWSGTGPLYTRTVDIDAYAYNKNAGIDISEFQGHSAIQVRVKADFVTKIKNQTFVASAYADQRRQSFLWQTPFTQEGYNAATVTPYTAFIDMGTYGLGAIKGMVESFGALVVFGEDRLVKFQVSDGIASTDQQYQFRGASSPDALFSINGLVYFVSIEDIYYYSSSQQVVKSITESFVREAWRALATADKQAAAIGYDRRNDKLIIAAGSTIFVYNLPKPLADTLSTDTQAIGAWQKYNVGLTFASFYTNVDGACIGITSAGVGYELFSSSATSNNLIYESPEMQGAFSVEAVRLVYTDSGFVMVQIYDLEKNASYPIKSYRFPPQSTLKQYDLYAGCFTNRMKIRIEGGQNTVISKLIINPDGKDEG